MRSRSDDHATSSAGHGKKERHWKKKERGRKTKEVSALTSGLFQESAAKRHMRDYLREI